MPKDAQTCFLIDDDPDDREIFALALENINDSCKCITANNGIKALEMLDKNPDAVPDFIFLDLNMPYMSGSECLKQIRKIPHTANIPVIIYTTSSYSKDIESTKQLGASHFMVKPTAISGLSKMLSEILERREMPYYLEHAG